MDYIITVMFFAFMSIVLAVYYCVPKKHRYLVLLIFSFVFYAVYSKFLTIFLCFTILSLYFAGLLMNRLDDGFIKKKEGLDKDAKKALKNKIKKQKSFITAFTVCLNILILAALKYSGMFADLFEGVLSWFNVSKKIPVLKLGLPLGISYYTLSGIGYLINVKRKGGNDYRAETNFGKFALFMMYFPQMLEGPFAFYDELAPQLYEGHDWDKNRCTKGLLTACYGLILKFVVADRLAIIASEVFKNYSVYGGGIIALGILAFTLQLYAEFSGIIDFVSGISQLFGITLAKNFEQPFFSKDVNEFWRRWHISLGRWFKEFVFYPIAMSKPMMKLNKKIHGKVNKFFETFIPSSVALFFVWFLNGMWHGASVKYIVYGLYYYAIMMIGMLIKPLFDRIFAKANLSQKPKAQKTLDVLRVIRTFIIVNIGMLLFRAKNLHVFGEMFLGLFKGGALLLSPGVIDIYDGILCILGVLFMIMADVVKEYRLIDFGNWLAMRNLAIRSASFISIFAFVLIFGAYGQGYVPVDPIYGGF